MDNIAPASVESARARQAPPKILLVDDDDAVRRSLLLLLQSKGYHVRAYSSVGAAWDEQARDFDGLIADLVLPGANGIALLKRLRGAGWMGPAILISGFLDEGEIEAANAAGFDFVFPKPTSQSVLIRALERLFGR